MRGQHRVPREFSPWLGCPYGYVIPTVAAADRGKFQLPIGYFLSVKYEKTCLKKRPKSRLTRCWMRSAFVSVALAILLVVVLVNMPVSYAQTLTWERGTLPGDNTVSSSGSVYCVSVSDCWAVGGGFFHWTGSSWNPVSSPTNGRPLNSVFCISSSDCWAVGWETIIQWNGASWVTVTSPTKIYFRSVYCASASNCWAVGDSGVIFQWTGSSWSTVSSPTTLDLRSVFCVNANDCWAVGESGTILQGNGSSWRGIEHPTDKKLNSVFCVSANDCWAAGVEGVTIHWAGSYWSTVTSPTTTPTTTDELSSVFCVSASDCWAVGYYGGTIIHWAGSYWGEVEVQPNAGFYSVFCVSSSDCWALGVYEHIFHGRVSSTSGGSSIPGRSSMAGFSLFAVAGGVVFTVVVAVAFLTVRKRMVRPDLRSKPSHAAAHPVRFCMNCGQKISEGERFCKKCGTKQN